MNYTWVFPSILYKWTPSWLQAMKAPIPRANESSYTLCPADDIIFGKLNSSVFANASLLRTLDDSNLVDPASSHMLVSKTKPCMSKYKYYTAKLRMAH